MTLVNLTSMGLALVLSARIQNELQRRTTDREFRDRRIERENQSLQDARERLEINREQRLREMEREQNLDNRSNPGAVNSQARNEVQNIRNTINS